MESQNSKFKRQKAGKVLLATLTLNFLLLASGVAHASTASGDNFQLDIEEIDPAFERPYTTPTPTPQPEQKGTVGILTTPSAFSFTISEPLIDFGVLSATNPITRTTTLKVSSPGSGYQVFAIANHMLLSKKNISIPDTTCDNGSCSENTEAMWENNLTYGLGYRCEHITPYTCTQGFERENTFKQFSDLSKKELTLPIMRADLASIDHQARIVYKLNISGTQPKEAYTNTVTYIAVPNY